MIRKTPFVVMFAAVLGLQGCGHLVRAELGPEYVAGKGVAAHAQVTAGYAIIGGSGLYEAVVLGGWATSDLDEVSGGVLVGINAGITPGGVDQERTAKREGFGGTVRFAPPIGADGIDFGGGLALMHGVGEAGEKHTWSFGGGSKGGFSVRSRDYTYRSWGVALDVSRRIQEEGFETAGPLRFKTLLLAEYLKIRD